MIQYTHDLTDSVPGTAAAAIIGITTDNRNETNRYALRGSYSDAVRAVGGVPLLLPPGEPQPERLLAALDGLILSGGGDIDPAQYGQPRHPTNYLIDTERDAFDLQMARLASEHGLPVLGICRGAQVLTVAHGGDMIVDIGEAIGTTVDHGTTPTAKTANRLEFAQHPVTVAPDSLLARVLGVTEIMVPSMHHQAARAVPPGWRVSAHAADGVIEALEYPAHPWLLAVQWHPEAAYEIPTHRNLFAALVAAAAHYRIAGAAPV